MFKVELVCEHKWNRTVNTENRTRQNMLKMAQIKQRTEQQDYKVLQVQD